MDQIYSVIMILLAGTGTGLLFYLNKSLKEDGEKFDIKKLGDTLAVSIMVAAIAITLDFKLTSENYLVFITANSGAIVLIQTAVTAGWRWVTVLMKY